jgi:hypothetical protein
MWLVIPGSLFSGVWQVYERCRRLINHNFIHFGACLCMTGRACWSHPGLHWLLRRPQIGLKSTENRGQINFRMAACLSRPRLHKASCACRVSHPRSTLYPLGGLNARLPSLSNRKSEETRKMGSGEGSTRCKIDQNWTKIDQNWAKGTPKTSRI